MDLDTKTEQEREEFWKDLKHEASNCVPDSESASRERLLEQLATYKKSYDCYLVMKTNPPAADAPELRQELYKTTVETLLSKYVQDKQAYKLKLVEFRFGAKAAKSLQDNTTSKLLSADEIKTCAAIRAKDKKEDGTSGQARYSPYRKSGRSNYHSGAANSAWTASSPAPEFAWPGTYQGGYNRMHHSGGRGAATAAATRLATSSPNYRPSAPDQQHPPYVMYPANQYAYSYEMYRPGVEEKKKTTQCFMCEEFGHWAKDGVCKPEDVQRVQERKQAADVPALQFQGN